MTDDDPFAWSDADEAAFQAKLAAMRGGDAQAGVAAERSAAGERSDAVSNLWLAHRWPPAYPDRCVHIGGRWVCRRCLVLYSIGTVVAVLFAFGLELWPRAWDPGMIYLLCVPATVAYCGEAIGLFGYDPRWQTTAMAITAVGFGRGLGYEFLDRWSGEFWWPVTVFGGLWFAATVIAALRRRRPQPATGDGT